MSVEATIVEMARQAKKAARDVAAATTDQKNRVLFSIADKIETRADAIQAENRKDIERAREMGLSPAMIDRLTITDATIASMAGGLREVADLADPVGEVTSTEERPSGIKVSRVRIPLGVIGMIYESRPNVTIDAAGLCLKAGNAIILRGGSEAFHSNTVLAECIADALTENGLPKEVVQLIPMRDREAVNILLKQEDFIDVMIPRGGEGLIRFVTANSLIPVLKHYKGVCHVYVDKEADLEKAKAICVNAKVQRPGVCNAMETMLVHKEVASAFLPLVGEAFKEAGVTLKGCPETRKHLAWAEEAEESDWPAEYLNLTLAVKVVDSVDDALDHIAAYNSGHTEAIVTKNEETAKRFVQGADSSAVMVNASTRFNDGGELGLGAEIGISTSKLHAFGPMGLEELTSRKFVVYGDGQIRG
ncbi:glutamate-5-semialdehyde dehydrogenase [Desulfoluna butyratoxydans]|uniref:Gamma-glutamyl phosphate reductase n=1 Tax=Desulfoluna butyratoxydans TaxID=231438 RepID=A0A4U8YJI2_9BACT|nr:glutamate-5-semialdehyde dehydrogenase [Desulfoluna butyratoxydans]VFQ43580.1 aldehyde/histidinol dehydrogenase [Desulfoluna butyratoxydans]